MTTGAVVEGLVYDAMELLADCTSLFGVVYPIEAVQARARMLQRIRDENASSYKYFAPLDELREVVDNDLVLLMTVYFEAAVACALGG